MRNSWSAPEWIEAFAQDPMLLKRPLFVKNGVAVLTGFRAKEEILQEKLGD